MSEPTRILGKLATLPMAALGVLLAATLVVEADAGSHLDRWSYLAAAVLLLAAAGGWLLTRPPTAPEPLRRLRRRTGRLVFGAIMLVTAVVAVVAAAVTLLGVWVIQRKLGQNPQWGYLLALLGTTTVAAVMDLNVRTFIAGRVRDHWAAVAAELQASGPLDISLEKILRDPVSYGDWTGPGRRARYAALKARTAAPAPIDADTAPAEPARADTATADGPTPGRPTDSGRWARP